MCQCMADSPQGLNLINPSTPALPAATTKLACGNMPKTPLSAELQCKADVTAKAHATHQAWKCIERC
jgi:hypothetical protein